LTEKLTFTAFYPHPPERVWRALTDAKALAAWLLPADFRPEAGRTFRFDASVPIQGTVLEVDENKLLSYTWIDGEDGEAGTPSKVTWRLRPRDGGTELRLEHLPADYVEPMVLIEAGMNWRFALYAALPAILGCPRVPIVYVADEPESPEVAARRAGFRQSEDPLTLASASRGQASRQSEGKR